MSACFSTDFLLDGFAETLPWRGTLPPEYFTHAECSEQYLLSITKRPITCPDGHMVVEISHDMKSVYVHCVEGDID